MNLFKLCRELTQRLLIASVALALAGCASMPWGDLFTSSPDARPPSIEPPAPVAAGFYRVNPGDTLASVAAAFGRDPAQLARWNRLPDAYPVSVGQVLRVAPDAAAVSGPVQTGVPQSPAATGNVAASAASSQQARFIWPASGQVTSNAGDGQSKAIHINGTAGETIRAASTGRVIYAGSEIKAYGLLVIVKHDKRFISAYGNNAKLLVKEGDTVRQGQPIAEMGAPNDPHPYLIFELRDGTKAVDPQNYLPKLSG
ncbi:peptidoglycan DD-metalloendopeptidase family protein [Paraburkholderia caribensis]|uniref:peptidoglycan DD-metalloendopeptidase family protein n=1 Tax=Paraburkholderia caribensis TaxID=75105 RepID=UPI00285EF498|nr:peptidoglycan DD-metalloendopeptidase family protein [Paraburkholderia caribensis]MDR6385976.1 lipoprotein NlpD [Paraburkholderia caribensis]